jgi:hypothetical protein
LRRLITAFGSASLILVATPPASHLYFGRPDADRPPVTLSTLRPRLPGDLAPAVDFRLRRGGHIDEDRARLCPRHHVEVHERAAGLVQRALRAAVLGFVSIAVPVAVGLDRHHYRDADVDFDVEAARFADRPGAFDEPRGAAAVVVAEQRRLRTGEADVRVVRRRDAGREFARPRADRLESALADLAVVFFADLAVDDQLLLDRRLVGRGMDAPAGDHAARVHVGLRREGAAVVEGDRGRVGPAFVRDALAADGLAGGGGAGAEAENGGSGRDESGAGLRGTARFHR